MRKSIIRQVIKMWRLGRSFGASRRRTFKICRSYVWKRLFVRGF